MNANRPLRITRIIVSLLAFLILSVWLLFGISIIPGVAPLIEKLQFVPAVISGSIIVFVGWGIATLIFGRIYCSTMCPLGTLQDIAARCRPRRQYHYALPLNRIRVVFLIIMLGCLMGGFALLPSILDPASYYAEICRRLLIPVSGTLIALAMLLIVWFVAARHGRLICNTVCPVGTTLGFVSHNAIFRIDIDTDKCIQCRNCEHACKAQCINLTDHVVDSSRCINCFDCINVCPNDAIHYTTTRKQLSIPMMQSIKPLGPQTDATINEATSSQIENPHNK